MAVEMWFSGDGWPGSPESAIAYYAEREPGSDPRVEPVPTPKCPNGYAVARYGGKVLGKYERNGYDDSDFYAIVWDGEVIRHVEYDTTRFAGGGSATIDATPEVMAAAREYTFQLQFKHWQEEQWKAALRVDVGKEVRVTKGRKVPVGTIGIVLRMMDDQYSYSHYSKKYTKQRALLALPDGSTAWTSDENLEVVDPIEYTQPFAEGERTCRQHALTCNWRSATAVAVTLPSGQVAVLA